MKFSLGQTLSTPGALEAMQQAGVHPRDLLVRHIHGDWGCVDKDDAKANDRALKDGSRLVSAYIITEGAKVWIITEADRSSTTILLPSEY